MNPITPTVGRIVYFIPAAAINQSITTDYQTGVCAALVTAVHNENCVNLAVFDANGYQHPRHSVCHVSTLSEVAAGDVNQHDCWDWMPYQKEQASRKVGVCGSVGGDKSDSTKDAIIEQEIIDKGLIYPRVEKSRIDDLMAKVRFDCHIVEGTTTTVITAILPITDHINFTVATEIMACVDPRNFNKELGEKYGIEKAANSARNKLWELEGYYLARQLEQDMALDAAIASGELEIVGVEALGETTPQQRVLLEKHDLDEKIEKLSAFLSKPKPDFVSEAQWGLMSFQIHHMKNYREVLRDRLIDFGVIAEPLSPHNTINS